MKAISFLIGITVLCYSATIPQLTFYQSYASYSYPAYPNDTCSKLKVTSNYVFRLGTNNVISVVNKASLITKSNLLNYTYSLSSPNNQNLILDYDVDQNQTYLTLSQTSSTKILNLTDFSIKWTANPSSPFYKVSFNNLVLSGSVHAAIIDIFYKYSIGGLNLGSILVLPPPMILTSVRNCQSVTSPNGNYIVYWDQYTNVYVYDFTNTLLLPTYIGQITSTCKLANLTQTITFSSNSQYFIIEADNQLPVKIVSLISGQMLRVRSFAYNGTINKVMFLDSQNYYIALFNDTSVTLIETSTFNFLKTQDLSCFTSIIEIDYVTERIYICKNSGFDVYNLSMQSSNCSANCLSCVDASICQSCAIGYIIANSSCVVDQSNYSIPTNNVTNSTQTVTNTTDSTTNSTNPNNDSSNSNNTSPAINITDLNLTKNGNQTFIIMIMPDGSIMVLQITFLQAQILNNTRQALKVSNQILQKLIVFLSSSPYIYLCLSSLQFFTISCLYGLLHVPIPEMIYNTLVETATALNSNIFTVLNIHVSVPALGVEKVDSDRQVQFGVSSLFLPSNYQYLFLSIAVLVVLYLLQKLLKFCQPVSKVLMLILSHNKASVLFGLMISGMSQAFLPYLYIYENSYSLNFQDKINQTLQFIFIGIFFISGPMFIAYDMKNGKRIEKEKYVLDQQQQKIKIKRKVTDPNMQTLKKKRSHIYMIALNLVFPFLVMLEESIYFLVVNLIVLMFGLYKACLSKSKFNPFMLNLYPILFHMCFVIFYFANNPSVIVITQITCILVYFVGSLHQLMTIFVQFIQYVYRILSAKTSENRVHPQSTAESETFNEGKQENSSQPKATFVETKHKLIFSKTAVKDRKFGGPRTKKTLMSCIKHDEIFSLSFKIKNSQEKKSKDEEIPQILINEQLPKKSRRFKRG